MIEPRTRRFTIADGMILVAASAVAVLITREYVTSGFIVHKRASTERLMELVGGVSTCSIAPIMVALIPIRLLRPRPGLGRLARQPGFAACFAITAVLAAGLAEGLLRVNFQGTQDW